MLKRISLFNLILALFIILWGAWVRLSGSGAGCGEHWPLCNGAVIPLEPSVKTLIEFTHRLTSGIFGITVLWGYVCSRKTGVSIIKKSFLLTGVFTLTEALIGAILVKAGLVESNSSGLRALVISLHLVNTLALLYFLTQNYFLASRSEVGKDLKHIKRPNIVRINWWLFGLAGATGAIAALGNTLFPETSLIQGIAKDFSSSSHFLINLRVLHPVFAISLVVGLYLSSDLFSPKARRQLIVFCFIAVSWGVINWILLAPSWGALIHLLIGDLLFCFYSYQVFKSFMPVRQ